MDFFDSCLEMLKTVGEMLVAIDNRDLFSAWEIGISLVMNY